MSTPSLTLLHGGTRYDFTAVVRAYNRLPVGDRPRPFRCIVDSVAVDLTQYAARVPRGPATWRDETAETRASLLVLRPRRHPTLALKLDDPLRHHGDRGTSATIVYQVGSATVRVRLDNALRTQLQAQGGGILQEEPYHPPPPADYDYVEATTQRRPRRPRPSSSCEDSSASMYWLRWLLFLSVLATVVLVVVARQQQSQP